MKKDTVNYIYYRTGCISCESGQFGGLTVAYKLNDNGLVIGISKCNMKDRFVKKIGREYSLKNLNTAPLFIDNVTLKELVNLELESVFHSVPDYNVEDVKGPFISKIVEDFIQHVVL